MKLRNWILLILALTFFISCGKKKESEPAQTQTPDKPQETTLKNNEPDHIEVQHILISFKGKINKATVTRNQEEAKTLAYKLLERAKKGENFDELVEQYTDDSAPGKYKMANTGIAPNKTIREFSREGMVAAFGDVGFPLKVGEIGIADFDPKTSKYGWHIIKRIK